MYIDKETGEWGLLPWQIMERHPDTIWPSPFVPLARYELVVDVAPPEHDQDTHKGVQTDPLLTEGEYQQQWMIVKLDAAELKARADARARAEKEARDAARVSATKRQVLLSLFDLAGIREDAILAAINEIEDEGRRYRTLVDWTGAASIESDSATVAQLAQALGISERLPELFAYAVRQ